MLSIKHEPTKDFYSSFIVEATSIEEVINNMIPKIRPKSQDFYRKNITEELSKKGQTIIDRHAGNGNFYEIIFIS